MSAAVITAVITALAAWRPQSITFSEWRKRARRVERTSHIEHSGWHAWIGAWHAEHVHYGLAHGAAKRTAAPERTHRGMCMGMGTGTQRGAPRVPVATHRDLSGLAAQVANTLSASRAPGARPPDIVIFCHSSLDEHVSTTTAGRLRAELDAPCFAFSVSQQQGASVFTALRLATDLLSAEPDVSTILIVAAEKWHPPFSRWATPYLLQGDAAGALLIERASDSARGLLVLEASTARTASRAMSQLHCAPGVTREWAPPLISLIARLLACHGHHGREIDEVVGHRGSTLLTHAVCQYLGREDRCALENHHVHLGAAETIVRLAERLHGTALPQRARLLLWGFGLGGYVGGALLEANGAPHVTLEEHA